MKRPIRPGVSGDAKLNEASPIAGTQLEQPITIAVTTHAVEAAAPIVPPRLQRSISAEARSGTARLSWLSQALLVTLVPWGAFAFGSVYPWAYWPLAVAAVAAGALGHRAAVGQPSLYLMPLVASLTLFAVGATLQLVPIPREWLATISPNTLDIVDTFDLMAAGNRGPHPLSVDPSLTGVALALFVCFALLMTGSARLFTARGPRGTAGAIAIIGGLLALIAIVQKPLAGAAIYGLWIPQEGYLPFGPFVNNNHFAGWMLMALPLTCGLLAGNVARGMRHVAPTWRDRIIWLSSPDASRLMLLAGAAALMALSVALTLSRSGIGAAMFALVLGATVAMRRQQGPTRRVLVFGVVALLIGGVAAWAGIDRITTHYAETDGGLNNRWGAWTDAVAIAAKFPLAGTGLNTYGVATVLYQEHDVVHHYSTAHNDYLQVAAEGGLLLVVPAALVVLAFTVLVWKRFRAETSSSAYWLRVGAVTGLLAIAVQETVEFSLQMPGNAALFAIVCGIALHRTPERPRR